MIDTLYRDGPGLLADIGGTNARFALQRSPGHIEAPETLACAAYPRFEDAVAAYLGRHAGADAARRVRHAVIAIANPVDGDRIKMTNHCWEFSLQQARAELGLETLLAVNDFAALAMAVPRLAPSELVQVGGGAPLPGGAVGLVGAGTGLGVAGLLPRHAHGSGDEPERWTVLESEGGHVAFSPADGREQDILAYCRQRWEHVSAERLVSGPGLALIREALAARTGQEVDTLDPATIVERALDGGDPLCLETLETFCAMLGTVAANVAVTLCARGGIYIGGGVVPRLGTWFARSPFRARFENKGRFSSFTARIPCYVIHAPYPALGGAAALLARHLARTDVDAETSAHGAAIPGAAQRPSHPFPEVGHGHA